jgi:hypothetical protein
MRTDGFFRTFCICALFATLYVIVDGAREGMTMRDAIVGGVAIGLFTGLFLAVWLGIMRHTLSGLGARVSRLLKRAQGGPELEVLERITLALPPDRALALCRAAVEGVPGVSGVRADGASVRAMAGARWTGSGQRIECRVLPAEGGSAVEIRALPQWRLIGLGLHERRAHVERIRAHLAKHASTPMLAASPPPEAEAPFLVHERAETGLRR